MRFLCEVWCRGRQERAGRVEKSRKKERYAGVEADSWHRHKSCWTLAQEKLIGAICVPYEPPYSEGSKSTIDALPIQP